MEYGIYAISLEAYIHMVQEKPPPVTLLSIPSLTAEVIFENHFDSARIDKKIPRFDSRTFFHLCQRESQREMHQRHIPLHSTNPIMILEHFHRHQLHQHRDHLIH